MAAQRQPRVIKLSARVTDPDNHGEHEAYTLGTLTSIATRNVRDISNELPVLGDGSGSPSPSTSGEPLSPLQNGCNAPTPPSSGTPTPPASFVNLLSDTEDGQEAQPVHQGIHHNVIKSMLTYVGF